MSVFVAIHFIECFLFTTADRYVSLTNLGPTSQVGYDCVYFRAA